MEKLRPKVDIIHAVGGEWILHVTIDGQAHQFAVLDHEVVPLFQSVVRCANQFSGIWGLVKDTLMGAKQS